MQQRTFAGLASPMHLGRSLYSHRSLVFALAKREVVSRYRGSVLGLLWSFLSPLMMLAVHTFVFAVVFNARWPGGSGSRVEFALVLFTGLIPFGFFAECINRAPSLIVANVGYVKKVVFPLEVLPVVAMLSAGFQALVALFVWLGFYLIFFGLPPPTMVLAPVAVLPLVFLTAGIAWFLAALGVYVRDVAQVTSVLTTVLMFMSPLFYALDTMPSAYRPYMLANPLTPVIEQFRNVMLWNTGIDWQQWAWFVPVTLAVAWLGFAWFDKTRGGFADVL